jgi:hypothetical protein
MKRSEMVEIIEMAIDISRGQYNTHQLSQRIVEVIETAGMLPPGIYVARGPFETVEYEWEGEDEA